MHEFLFFECVTCDMIDLFIDTGILDVKADCQIEN